MRDKLLLSVWLLCGSWVAVSPWAVVGLAAAGADLRLVDSAKNQDWETVGLLTGQGLDVDAVQPDGATALHWVAYWNDRDTLDLLIEAGSNLDAQNDYGATPLWAACANRHGGSRYSASHGD